MVSLEYNFRYTLLKYYFDDNLLLCLCFNITQRQIFKGKISLCVQFNLKKESLLREFTELKQQLRFGPLQSCFSASSVVGF